MNRKGLTNNRYIVTIIVLMGLFSAVFTGCATHGFKPRNMASVSRYFNMDVNTVWEAIIQAIKGIPIEMENKEKGILRTQWVKELSKNKSMGLLMEGYWQERYRLFIKVIGEQNQTYVSVNAQVETKPPGGSRAYRWDRIVSDGTREQDFLKRLESILNNFTTEKIP